LLRKSFKAAATNVTNKVPIYPPLLDDEATEKGCLALPTADTPFEFVFVSLARLDRITALTATRAGHSVIEIDKTGALKIGDTPFAVIPVPRGALLTLRGRAAGIGLSEVKHVVVTQDLSMWERLDERRCVYLSAALPPNQNVWLDGEQVEPGPLMVSKAADHKFVVGSYEPGSSSMFQYDLPREELQLASGEVCVDVSFDLLRSNTVTQVDPALGESCPSSWQRVLRKRVKSALKSRPNDGVYEDLQDLASFSEALGELGRALAGRTTEEEEDAKRIDTLDVLNHLTRKAWRKGLDGVYGFNLECPNGLEDGYTLEGYKVNLKKARETGGDVQTRDVIRRERQSFAAASDMNAAVAAIIERLNKRSYAGIASISATRILSTAVKPLSVRVISADEYHDVTLEPQPSCPRTRGRSRDDVIAQIHRQRYWGFRSVPRFRRDGSSDSLSVGTPTTHRLRGTPQPGWYLVVLWEGETPRDYRCVRVYENPLGLGVGVLFAQDATPESAATQDLHVEFHARFFYRVDRFGLGVFLGYAAEFAKFPAPPVLPSPNADDVSDYDALGGQSTRQERHGMVLGLRPSFSFNFIRFLKLLLAAEGAVKTVYTGPTERRVAGRLGGALGYQFTPGPARVDLGVGAAAAFGPYSLARVRGVGLLITGSLSVSWGWGAKTKWTNRTYF
jgi:hypothetical protein